MTSPTSQLILILQAFRHFTYVTVLSPTLPSLNLRHNSFSNPSVASPTVTAHYPTLSLPILRHKIFTYVTWRAAHGVIILKVYKCCIPVNKALSEISNCCYFFLSTFVGGINKMSQIKLLVLCLNFYPLFNVCIYPLDSFSHNKSHKNREICICAPC